MLVTGDILNETAMFVALPVQVPELNLYQNCPEHGSHLL
jgi:hypothetical protein